MNVHILATVRNPKLLDAALLVFKTIRVGFPNANLFVTTNTHHTPSKGAIVSAALGVGAKVNDDTGTIHHVWIEDLLKEETEPFFICDTDMVFHSEFDCGPIEVNAPPLSGAVIPRFRDPFTKCITMPRFHTSLLYMDPKAIWDSITAWQRKMPATEFNPPINLFYPVVIPNGETGIFYDTCALLARAIGGLPFTSEQMEAYDHLHCGTWSDIVSSAIPGLEEAHREIFSDNSLASRLKPAQAAFYKHYEC